MLFLEKMEIGYGSRARLGFLGEMYQADLVS